MAYYVTVINFLGFQILKKRSGRYYFRLGNGKVRKFRMEKKQLAKR